MILVVSGPGDEHAQLVLRALAGRGADAQLLDLADIPQRTSLSIGFGRQDTERRLFSDGIRTDLADCTAVWWRRPGAYVPHSDVRNPAHRQFVLNECHEAVTGLWQTLDAFWVNHPNRDLVASRKLYQLQVARSVGFRIPRTLVTNVPSEARDFVSALGRERAIYKAFTATRQDWRETRLVKEEEGRLMDSVRFAPVIFQEYIDADVDVRVTVIDKRIFAAAIHSQDSRYKVDFRMDMVNVDVKPLELPQGVCSLLEAFMHELGLVYGAIDLRRTPDGDYVFLEVNPAGQWLFVEARTGQPITDTLAETLLNAASNT